MSNTKSCDVGETLPAGSKTPQPMSLDEMIKSGIVEKVSSGEVCSISVAKQLGIFDRLNYYKPGYETLKTFNEYIDTSQNRNQFSICSANSVIKTATPSCYLLPTAGVGFTTKQGFDKCITSDCPPGFREDPINPKLCKKPLYVKTVLLNTRNDERWYDWYDIPNYHLGNKYSSSSNIHYKPCGPDEVPNYAIDPADGERKDWSSSDKIDECISKSIYFGGKYDKTSDYCPIAMIKRVGVSQAELENYYSDLLDKDFLSPAQKQEINQLYNDFKKSYYAQISVPTERVKDACEKIESPTRLREAYNICEQLIKNEPSFINKFKEESETEINMRKYVTKFNCHQLFCPTANKLDPANKIGKGGICFPSIGEDPSKVNEAVSTHYTQTAAVAAAAQARSISSAEDALGASPASSSSCALANVYGPVSCSTNPQSVGEPISCEKEKNLFIHHVTKTPIIIIGITILIALIITLIIILEPLFVRLWNWIKCRLIRYRRFAHLHCYTSEELTAVMDAKNILRKNK